MNELSKNLKKEEKIVAKGEKIFIQVGSALTRIRDGKLYSEKYENFDDYCKVRWGWGRQRAYQLIEAAETVKSLPENVKHVLQNPRQASELKDVTEETAVQVLETAKSRGKTTAKKLKDIIAEIENPKPEEKLIELDKTGYPIPDGIFADWNRADSEGKNLLHKASELKNLIKGFMDKEDIIFTEVTNSALIDVGNAYTYLRCIIPHAVCTTCHGKKKDKCVLCNARGFISKFRYEQCVPVEIKAMREKIKASK